MTTPSVFVFYNFWGSISQIRKYFEFSLVVFISKQQSSVFFSSRCLYVPPVIFVQTHSPTQMLWNCFCGYLPLPVMFPAHTSIHRHEERAFTKMISKCSKDINHPRTLTRVSVLLPVFGNRANNVSQSEPVSCGFSFYLYFNCCLSVYFVSFFSSTCSHAQFFRNSTSFTASLLFLEKKRKAKQLQAISKPVLSVYNWGMFTLSVLYTLGFFVHKDVQWYIFFFIKENRCLTRFASAYFSDGS